MAYTNGVLTAMLFSGTMVGTDMALATRAGFALKKLPVLIDWVCFNTDKIRAQCDPFFHSYPLRTYDGGGALL